jgi:hypothetical protein
MFDDLTEDNYILYAMKYYDNPQCLSESDFYSDMNIIKYLKRLFNRYLSTGDLKERLILNHLITFYNLFPIEVGNRILFLKIPENSHSMLKTFLIHLDYMTDVIDKIDGKYIISSDILLDMNIVKHLREL